MNPDLAQSSDGRECGCKEKGSGEGRQRNLKTHDFASHGDQPALTASGEISPSSQSCSVARANHACDIRE